MSAAAAELNINRSVFHKMLKELHID
ncbi:MAG TPA: hypothetical protein ENN22_15935 [bacterium]|nr:hypothetical protein [bacterium]